MSPSLEGIVDLSEKADNIAPDSFTNLILTIYGTADLGVYEGNLTIGGDINQNIPIKIKIVILTKKIFQRNNYMTFIYKYYFSFYVIYFIEGFT